MKNVGVEVEVGGGIEAGKIRRGEVCDRVRREEERDDTNN